MTKIFTATKKPIPVKVMQIDPKHISDCIKFTKGKFSIKDDQVTIETLEGTMTGKMYDYIIQGVKGEFYICDRTIFEETYNRFEVKT